MTRDVNPMLSRCPFAGLIRDELLKVVKRPKIVLELGCGNGGNLAALKGKGRQLVGIEPMAENVELSKAFHVKDFEVRQGDHTTLAAYADQHFDLGFTVSVLNHMEDCNLALDELLRTCKVLVLFEPFTYNSPRQATEDDTTFYDITWYHQYKDMLKARGIHYAMRRFAFYDFNSGPKFHRFIINVAKQRQASE